MEAKRLSKDKISTLPSILIENILCRLRIRDAVRTSVLSRNWRYNWVTIPKVGFNMNSMFDKLNGEHQLDQPGNERAKVTKKCKLLYAIRQVLLLHQGPIVEFDLYMRADNTCTEIDQIMLHLSRKKTVKKLKLDLDRMDNFLPPHLYRLPLSIFSLHQLTDLYLCSCKFDFNPTFSGFSSLTSLSLINVKSSRETFLHLISGCPILKHFCLITGNPEDDEFVFTLEYNELFKCLPAVIEHLCISSWTFEECSASEDLPTTLDHLKSLDMYRMMFVYKLPALFLLIRNSPNLEKIRIVQEYVEDDEDHMESEVTSLDDYSDIWLEHLNELQIDDFGVSKLEVDFVKLILAKSPVLTKVRIVLEVDIEKDDELKMLRILLRCPRASPAVEIIVEPYPELIL